jgi:hypothetical protein
VSRAGKAGYDPHMAAPGLNWSRAEVKDATLVVSLEGELPTGWKKSFERTVTLLGGGDWGQVQLKKGSVRVSDVEAGTEEKLRHFLESVVEQANADHPPAEPDSSATDDDDADAETDADDEADAPDTQMTERFRSFAD